MKKALVIAFCGLLGTAFLGAASAEEAKPAAPAAPAAAAPAQTLQQMPKRDAPAAAKPTGPAASTNVGDPLVDFTLKDWNDKEVTFSSLQGKKGTVLIWAQSACSACRGEMARLEEAKKANPDVNFVLVMVDMAGAKVAKGVVEGLGANKGATVLFDPDFKSGNGYRVRQTPTVLIFKDKKIFDRIWSVDPEQDVIGDSLKKL